MENFQILKLRILNFEAAASNSLVKENSEFNLCPLLTHPFGSVVDRGCLLEVYQ